MITRTKAPQLHLLAALNLFGIAIAPLEGNLAVRVRVHEHVERAIAVQLRQEGHGSGDLPEDGLDFFLDFFFGFFCGGGGRGGGSAVWSGIFLVNRFAAAAALLAGLVE